MSDINITLGGDNKGLKKEIKESNRLLERQRRTQDRLDKRLSRKRARNRLKGIRARVRAEKAALREIERAERRSRQRRQRLLKAGLVGGAAGLVIGAAVGVAKGREILEFEERLARTAVQAKKTRAEQFKLGESITDAAVKYGVSRDVILNTFERIVDKSGDFDLAADNLDNISKIIRGTGADAGELGELIAALSSSFKGIDVGKGGIFEFLEVLISQGDEATINLSELASEAEKLLGAFVTGGFKTKKQFIEFGALLQIAGKGGGKAEAATFVSQFVNQLKKRASLIQEALGVSVTKKGGGLRDLGEVIPELLNATGGDLGKISKLIPSIRGAKPLELLAIAFQETNGELKEFNRLIKLGEDASGNIERKFQRVSETSSQAFKKIGTFSTKLFDVALVPVIDDLANAIEKILADPAKLRNTEEIFSAIATSLTLAAKSAGLLVKAGQKLSEIGRESVLGRLIGGTVGLAKTAAKKTGLISDPIQADKNFALNLQINNNQDGTADVEVQSLFNGDRGGKKITKSIRSGTTGSF